MSEREVKKTAEPVEDESGSKGPSLALMYSLVALALALAMGFAWMIVLPFANRH